MAKCRREEMVVLIGLLLMFSCTEVTAAERLSDQPENFQYYHQWASKDGETHLTKCKMQGFNLTSYSSALPQYLRSDFHSKPLTFRFSELPVGFTQPLHSPPDVHFIVTLSGSWYVNTTDGSSHKFVRGDVLFEDTTNEAPSESQPLHYSGTLGKKPCHMMFAQISRPPQVDTPCPF